MTPSTGIITCLAREEERLGVFAEQAEDEIAAINMALGASYAGARAMTATSGGGFALMVEGISLAGMTETPLVIVLAQRPGPATGLPTRTAQGELLFAINAGHGEFPKLVLAPSNPDDAFHKIVRAFNLADKYQMPVIVLTDHFLADSQFSISDFELDAIAPSFHLADPSQSTDYKRYQLTENGISPRLYPGQSEHLVGVDSDEHDEEGHITEELAATVPAMVQKRLAKFNALKKEIPPPEETDVNDSDTVLVGWGSSRGALLEALYLLRKEGKKVGIIHFTELWPLPEYAFPEGKTYRTVESNATAQLAKLLRSEYGVVFEGTTSRYDGLPLTGEYIRSRFNE
jgi:2-oxoglutarate ferredoxin oxidoreductase subunit alpha